MTAHTKTSKELFWNLKVYRLKRQKKVDFEEENHVSFTTNICLINCRETHKWEKEKKLKHLKTN